MKILNLTQHHATADQIAAGVIEPSNKAEITALLTFNSLPSRSLLSIRAQKLATIAAATGAEAAMIGGAPYFMPRLSAELYAAGIQPLYSFALREAADEVQPDGSVRKVAVFRHAGWVEG